MDTHDGVIKWKHLPRHWPFLWGIHRSSVNPSYKGQWRGALMFSLIWAWINGWVNNREAGDLRRHDDHYDVTVMSIWKGSWLLNSCQWYSLQWHHMSVMMSQITGNLIVYSTLCSDYQERKHQSSLLLATCEENPPVTHGFPSQKGK